MNLVDNTARVYLGYIVTRLQQAICLEESLESLEHRLYRIYAVYTKQNFHSLDSNYIAYTPLNLLGLDWKIVAILPSSHKCGFFLVIFNFAV